MVRSAHSRACHLQYLRPFGLKFTCVNQRLVRWSRTLSCPTASGRENRPAGPWTCFKPNLNGNYYFCIWLVQRPLTIIKLELKDAPDLPDSTECYGDDINIPHTWRTIESHSNKFDILFSAGYLDGQEFAYRWDPFIST